MRTWKTSLSEALKKGLSSTDPAIAANGLGSLKGLKSNGAYLVACGLQSTAIVPDPNGFSFNMGTSSFYTNGFAIWKLTGSVWNLMLPPSPFALQVGLVDLSFLDFIGFGILTSSTKQLFFDANGVYEINPTGFALPKCQTYAELEGQIVGGGILDGFNGLTNEFVAWSKIGSDSFAVDKSNDSGFYYPKVGRVQKVLSMFESFIVLGAKGSSLMYYAEHTFGFKRLDLPNICPMGLGASTNEFAFYISDTETLIKVNRKGEFADLDYGWIMKDVVSMQRLKNTEEILFQTVNNSFILDNFGLYSFGYKVYGETSIGLIVASGFEQSTLEFETGGIGEDLAGLKRISETYVNSNAKSPAFLRGFGILDNIKRYTSYAQQNNVMGSKRVVSANVVGFGFKTDYQKDLRVISISANVSKIDKRFGNGERVTRSESQNGY